MGSRPASPPPSPIVIVTCLRQSWRVSLSLWRPWMRSWPCSGNRSVGMRGITPIASLPSMRVRVVIYHAYLSHFSLTPSVPLHACPSFVTTARRREGHGQASRRGRGSVERAGRGLRGRGRGPGAAAPGGGGAGEGGGGGELICIVLHVRHPRRRTLFVLFIANPDLAFQI